MSIRLKRMNKKWEDKLKKDNRAFAWCDDLFSELKRLSKKNDTEFTNDVIASAVEFFDKSFTAEEKADCFLYLLGKVVRK